MQAAMINKHLYLIFTLVFAAALIPVCTDSGETDDSGSVSAVLKGKYLGQPRPGTTPERFGPNLVPSDGYLQSAPAFSPDGREAFWSVFEYDPFRLYILTMQMHRGRWSEPSIADFSQTGYAMNPVFSPDGKRIYFASDRPLDTNTESTGWNNWYVERRADTWSEPNHHGPLINGNNDWGASIARNGNLYFASIREGGMGKGDIWISGWEDEEYTTPVNPGANINSSARELYPYIAPDERYLLFISNRSGGKEATDEFFDIYVSFHMEDGSWSEAVPMKNQINSDRFENTPIVSGDGKYLFFMSKRDSRRGEVYWIDARVIEDMRKSHRFE